MWGFRNIYYSFINPFLLYLQSASFFSASFSFFCLSFIYHPLVVISPFLLNLSFFFLFSVLLSSIFLDLPFQSVLSLFFSLSLSPFLLLVSLLSFNIYQFNAFLFFSLLLFRSVYLFIIGVTVHSLCMSIFFFSDSIFFIYQSLSEAPLACRCLFILPGFITLSQLTLSFYYFSLSLPLSLSLFLLTQSFVYVYFLHCCPYFVCLYISIFLYWIYLSFIYQSLSRLSILLLLLLPRYIATLSSHFSVSLPSSLIERGNILVLFLLSVRLSIFFSSIHSLSPVNLLQSLFFFPTLSFIYLHFFYRVFLPLSFPPPITISSVIPSFPSIFYLILTFHCH
ncbi:unnamed protein product [Acanthosepion pharaonis]|uniref:Uncharacterized protein n=1 Tax=Acanthosepion pharaonis TaxID=158019 RepID=A0A812DBT0_ACAPH|nr:unnamed protein product [Sepia pharaonis]